MARGAARQPDLFPQQRRQVMPYKNPGDFEQIVEGLRKGGLPEPKLVPGSPITPRATPNWSVRSQ